MMADRRTQSTARALAWLANDRLGDETPAGVFGRPLVDDRCPVLRTASRPVALPAVAVAVGDPTVGGER